jgi:F0F1-type ATP synthase membrane subunit b/b'
MTNMMAEGGLQILPLDIVQHVLCLLILIFFMTTLVYNPVLNFINKRKEAVEATVKENEKLSAEVKEIKEDDVKVEGTTTEE